MITGFLLAYTAFTAPVIGWAIWSAWRKRAQEEVGGGISPEAMKSLETILAQTGAKHGMVAEVQVVPKTAAEAVMVQSARIIKAIGNLEVFMLRYFNDLQSHASINKTDMNAVMHAVQAGTKALLDMQKKEDSPAPEQAIESFVHTLEYARDRFTKSETQKKALELVITNVKTTHGTK